MKIAVVGLGHVGLPLQFARSCVSVMGLNVDAKKVQLPRQCCLYRLHRAQDYSRPYPDAPKRSNDPRGQSAAGRVRYYGTIRDRCFLNPSDLRLVSFNPAQRQRKRDSIRVCAVLRSAIVEGVTVAYTDRQAHKAFCPGSNAGLESC